MVRQFIEANRSDDLGAAVKTAVELADPNWEYTSVIASLEPGMYRGHDGIQTYFNALAASWEEWRCEPEEVFEVGPRTVFATVRFFATGKESGVAVEARLGLVAVLSNQGKVLRGHVYPSREEALEAAGLSD